MSAPRFRTLREAQQTRKRAWICRECEHFSHEKIKQCPTCGGKPYYFPSMREAHRYMVLRARERLGIIKLAQVHPRWTLTHEGVKICVVEYDFLYWRSTNSHDYLVIEDVKASKNPKALDPVWKLKRKLFEADTGHRVTIVTKPEE